MLSTLAQRPHPNRTSLALCPHPEQKPQPELHLLLTKSGVFNLYPTKDLSPATDLMGLENDIPDTLTARQTTITLDNVAGQASTTTHVSADTVRMINLLNAKALTYHVGGNLLVLAEWTLLEEKLTCKYINLLQSSS